MKQLRRFLRRSLWTAAFLSSLPGPLPLRAAPPPAMQTKPLDPARVAKAAEEAAEDELLVKLNFFSAPWPKVLEQVAEGTGSTLVLDKIPKGQFSRLDRNHYTRTEAVRVLNTELEPLGFRILEKGEFLVVLELDAIRAQYDRPVVEKADPNAPTPARKLIKPPSFPKYERRFDSIVPAHAEKDAEDAAKSKRKPGQIRQTSAEQPAPEPAPVATEQKPSAAPPKELPKVAAQHRTATDLARLVYQTFKPRAELIDHGPNNLPAFKVYESSKKAAVVFAVGIDTEHEQLVLDADPACADQLAKLFGELDRHPVSSEQAIRLVADVKDAGHFAPRLQNVLQLISSQKSRPQTRTLSGRAVAFQDEAAQPQQPNQQLPAEQQPPQPQQPPPDLPSLIGGLQGDVNVEALEDLGVLILRGNDKDVEAVMRVIREIERLSIGTTPEIHLLILKHVNSTALADLLNSVYESLSTLKRGETTPIKTVQVVPVVKPNAVLILAPTNDMESILKLADQLDQPIDPTNEVEVFRLSSAVASQVVTQLTQFYEEPTGLRPRVIATADARTNSVIIQASPRDLTEVANLIRKMDTPDSNAVSRMRVFPLRNAVAQDLAEVVNLSIQSVLNPPSTTGQLGAAPIAEGGETAQQLREAKSTVLEFLTIDGDRNSSVRSGILADIRITADSRTNSLLVTAPEQSMPLMEALINQLDLPSSNVAEIKVFTLANGDATAVVELLRALFEQQQQGQNQQGLQVIGADDASSTLIPLRFSVDVRTNSIIAIGGAEALRVIEAILLRLDESDIRQRQTTVIRLKNSPVQEVAEAINAFLTSQRDLAQIDPDLVSNTELLEREIIVVPEIVTNSLLISATPRYFEEISDLVNKLDEAPPQVVIQAMLVEVELTNTDEFGVEIGVQDDILFDRSVITPENITTVTETVTDAATGVQTTTQRIISQAATPGFNFNNQPLGNNTQISPAQVGEQALSNFSLGRVNGDLGFGGLVLSASSESLSVLLRALSARRTVHVLSRPQIRTLDNQEAVIQVGQQVPIVNGVNITSLGTANPLIIQDQAGIILTVTPRITPDDKIVMFVAAEKSAFTGNGVPIFTDAANGNVITSPIKDITTARTTVSVTNGQTIVLGGMITRSDNTLERKVPILGDIPLIGQAFRFDSTSTRRTELLIFLTPRVVDNDADSELIKQIEAERLHFIEEEAELIHGPLYSVPPAVEFNPMMAPLIDPEVAPLIPPLPAPVETPVEVIPEQPKAVAPTESAPKSNIPPVETPTPQPPPPMIDEFVPPIEQAPAPSASTKYEEEVPFASPLPKKSEPKPAKTTQKPKKAPVKVSKKVEQPKAESKPERQQPATVEPGPSFPDDEIPTTVIEGNSADNFMTPPDFGDAATAGHETEAKKKVFELPPNPVFQQQTKGQKNNNDTVHKPKILLFREK